jgi:hypothetical protein
VVESADLQMSLRDAVVQDAPDIETSTMADPIAGGRGLLVGIAVGIASWIALLGIAWFVFV